MTDRIPLPLSTLHSLLGLSGMMVEDVTVFVDVEEYNRLCSQRKDRYEPDVDSRTMASYCGKLSSVGRALPHEGIRAIGGGAHKGILSYRPNAHLIAVAPDLLEVLRLYVEWLAIPQDRGGKNGRKGSAHQAFIEAKIAAIAKAEGRS